MRNRSVPNNQDHQRSAWGTRPPHDPRIWFSAPGAIHYENKRFRNHPHSFAHLSVTGRQCACRCEHCDAQLLRAMLPAETPEKMCVLVDRLIERGCRGILVSGGADPCGEVPLTGFTRAIRYAHERGLAVLVHSGLLRRETALALKDCGVDQVLTDVIGHERTIREVYHLKRSPEDCLRSMMICREAELDFAPHIVIGLHFGRILGEYRALRMIQEAQPRTLVLVILRPMPGTGMSAVQPPGLSDVEGVFTAARAWNPDTFLSLGCARPPGEYKRQVETLAIDCGFNGIAFPSDATVDYACHRGLLPVFTERCCSLAGNGYEQQYLDERTAAFAVGELR